MDPIDRLHRLSTGPGRRGLSVVLAVTLLTWACDSSSPTSQEPADEDPRVVWLQSQASSISVVPSDTDLSDLEPLRQAIGSARVVMLGEESHGDGTTFHAKKRLIHFLHQEMGFDVLAFESGLYELRKVWELMEGGEDAATAMSKGVFSIWMGSAEVEPLVTYVEEAARTANPLELAGFDCQFTGSASRDFLVQDLTDFLASHGAAAVSDDGWNGFTTALQGLIDGEWWQEKPTEAVKDSLQDFLGRVRDEVVGLSAGEEEAFWAQLLRSMEEQLEFNWLYTVGVWQPGVSSIRDMQMGDNLLWLVNEAFPGGKVIVWAATLHVSRAVEEIEWTASTASYAGYTTMGQVVWEGIGSDAYVVGFTAGLGQVGTWFGEAWTLQQPEEGSLEDLFMEAGFENAFLDLRSIPSGGEWLNGYLLSRPMGYSYMRARWPRHMDAIIFTRLMQRSTPLN